MPSEVLSKSWLFEIVDTDTKLIETSFTLTLPPQSYTIREKQRVSITKTFANAFIDDYGPDNLEITIKGISGTAHVFPTFRTQGTAGSVLDNVPAIDSSAPTRQELQMLGGDLGSQEGYDGKGAFYTFRKDIMRYKDRGKYDNKELRVYDLADEQAYKCALLEFSVDRNSQQPFRYPFTISLFVYARLDSKSAATGRIIEIAKDPVIALNAIDDTLSLAQTLYQGVVEFTNGIAVARREVFNLKAKVSNYISQTQQVIESPLTAIRYLLDILTGTGLIIYDLYVGGKTTIDRYVGATEMMESTIRGALSVYGFAVTEGSQQSRTLTLEESDGLDVSTGEVVPAFTPSTFAYTGLGTHIVIGSETLQDIALTEMGDSNLWPYIADVNGISTNADIAPGDILYIPLETASDLTDTKDAFIISEDAARNPFGADIQLDADGNMIVMESSDTSTVTGVDNLLQAINIRLTSIQGSLIKQTAVGIAASAGFAGTSLTLSYLRMSIRNTLMEDPRILDVKNLLIGIDGSQLNVSMEVIPIDYPTSLPVTVSI
jgi:nucleoid-associated protein YgaU